jgi:tetratricopeptide (TPR) repeat protein
MKQQLSPLEIVEYISLACTAAGTVTVVLLSQHVGYAIGPGALSLVLGAANRRKYSSGESNGAELVKIDQKLSEDVASVRQEIQTLPKSSDYNSLKSQIENLTVSVAELEQQKSGALTNVGVELNPIRQDIVQLRSQYGNLQEFFNELRDRVEVNWQQLPPPGQIEHLENEIKQMDAKLTQLPSKLQKMTATTSVDLTSVTAEIEALKQQLNNIGQGGDVNSLVPELEQLRRQVTALENTTDRLVVNSPNLAEKEEVRSLSITLQELQKQQEQLQQTAASDRSALTELRDRLESLQAQINRIGEQTPATVQTQNLSELQALQDRLEQLSHRVDQRMSLAVIEVKDGQTIELTGIEDALAKIADGIAEVKQEMESRISAIESIELTGLQQQLLDQQETLTALQQEYQNLLASTSDVLTSKGNGNQSLSESEYQQKIESLERALANTTESIDRIESFLATHTFAEPGNTITHEPDFSGAVDIAQIAILQGSVSQLAANLDNLEQQVQLLVTDGADGISDRVRDEIEILKENLNHLETSLLNRGGAENSDFIAERNLDRLTQELAQISLLNEKVASLESAFASAFANTTDLDPEIRIINQELQEIGILKDTIYQLSGNVEILERQVHALNPGNPNSITGELREQIESLMAKVEQLPETQISDDLTTNYETVVWRLDQLESGYLSLETQLKETQDVSNRNDEEITAQFLTLNALSELQQDINSMGQKLTELEKGLAEIQVSELAVTRQDIAILQDAVSDLATRLEQDLDKFNDREKVQELEQALAGLESKLSQAIAQLDEQFQALQLQTRQLEIEQAETQTATSQIDTLIGNSIARQMSGISQLLQDVAPCDYELLFDRPAIYDCLIQAIANSNKRLIIVCPWLNREIISGLLDEFEGFLERDGQLQIGWGHLADINEGEFPLLVQQQWHTETLTTRRQSYDALNDLEALREKYPNQLEYKVLGTHENFLVADEKMALISSHHFLSSARDIPEREVAVKTSSLKIIHGLIDRFTDSVLQPGNAEAYYNRGFERLEIGDYAGAMADYDASVALNPDRATSYNNRGLAKYHMGNVPGAIADYTKAIELDPDEPVTYFNRAVAYYKIGDYRHSITDYTQVIQRQDGIRISAENTGAYFQRAEAYRQLGEYESAVFDYTMAIRLAPNDPVAYNNRGLARYNQGDYLGSIEDYSETLTLNPNDAVAYSNRGVSRLKTGDYPGAVADFDSAIALKPDYASAYNNRGLARFEMGDRTEAIADLKQAAELFAAQGNIPSQQQTLDSLKRLGCEEG